jgi:uncharacterized protein (TIGR02996 family)
MTDRDALYQAIIAQPDEDTPRLVFADWLEEHGQGDRAAFIRAQIEEARAEPFSKQAREADERGDDLRRKHWREWTADVRELVERCRFERGFIGHVGADPGSFVPVAEALFEAHPIQSLRLGPPHHDPEHRASLVPVFELPCLARLRRLEFSPRTEFLDDEYMALATSAHLAGVTDLSLTVCPIYPPWLAELLVGDAFPALAGLDVADISNLRVSLTTALPRADHRHLRRLNVSGVTFNSEELQQVLSSRCLKEVEELRLGWTGRPGDPGPLSHLHVGWVIPWDRLVVLDLAGQRLGDEVAKEIAGRPEAAGLRWLGLANNSLSHEAVRMLVRSPHLKLNHLDVRGNGFDRADIANLKARFPDAVVVN